MNKSKSLIISTLVLVITFNLYFYYSKGKSPTQETEKNSINKELDEDFNLVEKETRKKLLNSEKKIATLDKQYTAIDLQLSKDLVSALSGKKSEKRLLELIRLANEFPSSDLLQYLAATNCLSQKAVSCNTELFSKRMLAIDPNSATAKSFLAAKHLKNDDLESMLNELSTIKSDDNYSSFFYELIEDLEPAFQNKINEKRSLAIDIFLPKLESQEFYDPEKHTVDSFMNSALKVNSIGIAAAQIANMDSAITCLKKLKTNYSDSRWSEACSNLAGAMSSAQTHIDQSLGYSIYEIIYKNRNDEANLIKIQNLKNEQTLISQAASKIMNSNDFKMGIGLDLYLQESKEFGEIEAMKRLIERESSN